MEKKEKLGNIKKRLCQFVLDRILDGEHCSDGKHYSQNRREEYSVVKVEDSPLQGI